LILQITNKEIIFSGSNVVNHTSEAVLKTWQKNLTELASMNILISYCGLFYDVSSTDYTALNGRTTDEW
jgi:hypothetical protein